MKYVLVSYKRTVEEGNTENKQMLLVGDRRQVPEEMVHLAFHDYYDEATETVQRAGRYSGPAGYEVEVLDFEVVSSQRAEELRKSTFTKYVNRNITEKFAPQTYSGSPR